MGVSILGMFNIISLIKGTCHHLVASDSSIAGAECIKFVTICCC